MASSTWKGFITFGLLSIPIRLYAAARASRMQLHQLHSVCNTRLRQPLFAPPAIKLSTAPKWLKAMSMRMANMF